MSDDNLPPVGATVTDAYGNEFKLVELDGYCLWKELGYDRPRYAEECQEPILVVAWRLQQERSQLKARVAQFDALAQEARRREAWVRGHGPDDGTWRDGEELLAALVQLAPKEGKP